MRRNFINSLMLYFIGATFSACNNSAVIKESQDSLILPAKDTATASVKKIMPGPDTTYIAINTDTGSFHLIPHRIKLQKGIEFDLNIPAGYNISIAAEGLRRLRFMSKSPDGRLFATDMFDKSDNKKGRVYVFSRWNDSTHQYRKVDTFLTGLHNPNQVAFYQKSDSSFIYVAETGRLIYYTYHNGDGVAQGVPVVIATFPDYGLDYKYGGWHLTRSIAFHNDKIYVSVGSSCNACIEKEEVRATIIEMNPDGTDKKIFASGLRNSVGIKWIDNQLWATSMGRDLIGPDKPEDLLMRVDSGVFYHWPFYYQYRGRIYPDKQMQDTATSNHISIPAAPQPAWAGFKAHSAPLGLDYFHDFSDPMLNNALLVALHGSTSVWRQRGNAVVKATGTNRYAEVVSGFLTGKTEKERHGRPCDVLMNDDKSFFVTDDHNGVLYYVWRVQ